MFVKGKGNYTAIVEHETEETFMRVMAVKYSPEKFEGTRIN